jgi:hypothetical protein
MGILARLPVRARVYLAWSGLAIGGALGLLAFGVGSRREAVTRVLVLGFLGAQLALRRPLIAALRRWPARARFVGLGCALAAVVEGLHMISEPVFASLRVGLDTPLPEALRRYAIDLAFTLPAYVVIFGVMDALRARWRWDPWTWLVVMGLGQAVGDGGLFYFAGALWMLAFLPWPMSNYHAVNLLPFLAVEGELAPQAAPGPAAHALAVAALVGTYLVCGAAIQGLGRALGLALGPA